MCIVRELVHLGLTIITQLQGGLQIGIIVEQIHLGQVVGIAIEIRLFRHQGAVVAKISDPLRLRR